MKKAAFAMVAWLAFKDKEAADKLFEEFFPIIKVAKEIQKRKLKR